VTPNVATFVGFQKKQFLGAAGILALASLSVILFASPLFQILSFEYSAVSAVSLSLVCGVGSVYRVSRLSKEKPFLDDLLELSAGTGLLSLIPFLLSALSLFWLPNCSFVDGIGYYAEVTLPSAFLGMLYGSFFGRVASTTKLAVWLFIAYWIVSLILSLLPGYFNPQLFTYGWQYGYFPGFVWDESVNVGPGYWWARLESLTLAIILLQSVWLGNVWRKDARLTRAASLGLLLTSIVYLALVLNHDNNRVVSSHNRVESYLSAKFTIGKNCTVFYRGNSLTLDEQDDLKEDLAWYIYDITNRFQLKEVGTIYIYLYPNTEALYEFIGTRSASIAKPWLSELHIAKENLESLKHELTHVLLREKGIFPFYASFSTGLTEGAAMSVESRYDGLFTIDEYAARILQMGYASGVSQVMSFTGFASNASSKSYILAGSFSRYLIHKYGYERFIRVYRSLDYEESYSKSLEELEKEWIGSLKPLQTPLTTYDSLRIRYYFDRSSIFFRSCIRRVGKISREAEAAVKREDYLAADSLYAEVLHEAGGVNALRSRAVANINLGRVAAAKAILDTTHVADEIKQRPALALVQGDVYFLNSDTSKALHYYQEASKLRLSEGYFLTAYTKYYLYGYSMTPTFWKSYLLRSYRDPSSFERIGTFSEVIKTATDARIKAAAEFILSDIYREEGNKHFEMNYLHSANQLMKQVANWSEADSLVNYFIELRMGVSDPVTPSAVKNSAKEERDELKNRNAFFRVREELRLSHKTSR